MSKSVTNHKYFKPDKDKNVKWQRLTLGSCIFKICSDFCWFPPPTKVFQHPTKAMPFRGPPTENLLIMWILCLHWLIQGLAKDASLPLGTISFIFMQFFCRNLVK